MKSLLATLISLITILVIFLIFLNTNIYHNRVDKKLWKELNSMVKEDDVCEIIVNPYNPVKLEGEMKKNFIIFLGKAQFYESNWRGAEQKGITIIIEFDEGPRRCFKYWGNSIFEITYKRRRFLVKSDDLAQILKEII